MTHSAKDLYVLNELNASLSHYTQAPLTRTQSFPLVPPPPANPLSLGTKSNVAGIIQLKTTSTTKATVVASTRLQPDRAADGLAFFDLDLQSGNLTFKEYAFPRQGKSESSTFSGRLSSGRPCLTSLASSSRQLFVA